ncbi:outer membrane beta-barrel protein [Serratia fonticola]|uniref:Porin family protein n=1 Tax=Serratia fonticola TaxID=47917 RepID=A0AAE7JSE8_SERFO|nr:outer membrane beta-barrel protein [Serratia fonticola]QKJ57896.1 porin family protein [Serratia fonticola]
MKIKKTCYALLFLIAPLSALAGQELSLNSGVTYIEGNDAGGHIQIGYQYGFTKNLGIYTGYAYGHASLAGDTALIISDGYAHPENITYHTIPLALQATLPLGHHSLYIRAGTNLYHEDNTIESKNGLGLYGAVGWKYYFGDKRNWNIGLSYQRMKMHNYNANIGTFDIGYGFY